MNAYELADEVMEHYKAELPRGFNVNWMKETATMLRQLQTENDALRKTVDSLFAGLESSINLNKAQSERQVKELTDDEIFEAVQDVFVHGKDEDILKFGRAVLRRAQEK